MKRRYRLPVLRFAPHVMVLVLSWVLNPVGVLPVMVRGRYAGSSKVSLVVLLILLPVVNAVVQVRLLLPLARNAGVPVGRSISERLPSWCRLELMMALNSD